jgi:hypothetical protein
MLYKALLHVHNLTWWIIFFSGLWANFKAWRGSLSGAIWTKAERLAGLIFSSALATQFFIGLMLYFNSDIVHRYLAGGIAGAERFTGAFFGLMHPLAMFTAVVVGQVGYSVSKRLGDDRAKYRAAVFCYTVALAIVLLSVPWPFLSYGRSLVP